MKSAKRNLSSNTRFYFESDRLKRLVFMIGFEFKAHISFNQRQLHRHTICNTHTHTHIQRYPEGADIVHFLFCTYFLFLIATPCEVYQVGLATTSFKFVHIPSGHQKETWKCFKKKMRKRKKMMSIRKNIIHNNKRIRTYLGCQTGSEEPFLRYS